MMEDGWDDIIRGDIARTRKVIADWRDICADERKAGSRFFTTEDVETLLNLTSNLLDHKETTLDYMRRLKREIENNEENVRYAAEGAIKEGVEKGYRLGVQAAMANPVSAVVGVLVNEELARRGTV